MTLAQWRAATGQDAHSIIAAPAELFVDPAAGDYRLKAGSPAIDRGTASQAAPRDLAGNARPGGPAIDIGAYERPSAQIGTPGDDTIYFLTSADGNSLNVYNGDPAMATPVLAWPLSSTQPLEIQSLAGNDRVVVQLMPGTSGPLGGVRFLAGDGENILIVESGSIAIDSTASGILDTTVKSGATLITSQLNQRSLTIEPGGRVTLRPANAVSVVTSLDLEDSVAVEQMPPTNRGSARTNADTVARNSDQVRNERRQAKQLGSFRLSRGCIWG
jgi:hypothetical protein